MSGDPGLAYLPLFVDLQGKHVLVVGGGTVAARKVDLLLRAGARPSLVAPDLDAALAQRVADGTVTRLPTPFRPSMLDGCRLAIAATDDRSLNATVAAAADRRGILVNVVDDPALCSAVMPAIVDRSPLVVAISTGGAAPALARRLRMLIEACLDDSWPALIMLCQRWRSRIAAARPSPASRRRFYDWLADGPVRSLLRAGRPDEAARDLARGLASPDDRRQDHGRVIIVGAGPGAPGLLTVDAVRALQAADVILHDQLVTPAILDWARRDAERIPVGKQAGGHATQQAHIHRLMLDHARAGRRVVRLKGGDPFVFGRGGEELEFLRAEGIEYEVVPGITAALACAAYGAIPLTHRDHAQSVRLVTAHCRESLDSLDWACLARERQTLAFYMGVAHARQVQRQLIRHGRSAATPVAIVENGSRPDQRVITGSLAQLGWLAAREQVRSPALLIVGEVAGLATRLHWFGQLVPAAGSPARAEAVPRQPCAA